MVDAGCLGLVQDRVSADFGFRTGFLALERVFQVFGFCCFDFALCCLIWVC